MLSKFANLQNATLKQHDLIFEYFWNLMLNTLEQLFLNFW